MLQLSYVLPLRWSSFDDPEGLTAYLKWLAMRAEVVVVDGSAPAVFAKHAEWWRDQVIHLAPAPDLTFANGKVNGVITGMRTATHEAVVIADDDVRYDDPSLRRMAELLERVDLVRPQNYFEPTPWHAQLDTGRTLLNRAFGRDYPGTLGVRRSLFLAMGGYDGDSLFENLELIRTVEAAGGTSAAPLDLYVARCPPSTATFWSQRVRQAFDDLAQPARLALFLSVLPAGVWLLLRRHWLALAGGGFAATALAELGRRRGGGRRVFSPLASLCAPIWVLERAVCSWFAVGTKALRGGITYRGRIIPRAATSRKALRRRFEDRRPRVPSISGGAGPHGAKRSGLVGAVAERLGAGSPAPAQGDDATADADFLATLVDHADGAADKVGSLRAGGDDHFALPTHDFPRRPFDLRNSYPYPAEAMRNGQENVRGTAG